MNKVFAEMEGMDQNSEKEPELQYTGSLTKKFSQQISRLQSSLADASSNIVKQQTKFVANYTNKKIDP